MQAARVAAQLREAARDMARIAARRAKAETEPADRSRPESDALAAGAEDTPHECGEHAASRTPD
jgi:hypothetical protein